eukprot:c43654_g1_i1 orf=16-240(+)
MPRTCFMESLSIGTKCEDEGLKSLMTKLQFLKVPRKAQDLEIYDESAKILNLCVARTIILSWVKFLELKVTQKQ